MSTEATWQRCTLYYSIPPILMYAMLRRAQQWSAEHGGRFDVTPRAIYLTGPAANGSEPPRVAAISYRHMVIGSSLDLLAWHPALSSEAEVRDALRWLVGRIPDAGEHDAPHLSPLTSG